MRRGRAAWGARPGRTSARIIPAMVPPPSASRPATSSTKTRLRANTSVQGPVVPYSGENCSGAPYAGVNDPPSPSRTTSWATAATPKSSSLQPPARTNTLPGFTSRCVIPRSCASVSARATGSSKQMASATVRSRAPSARSRVTIASSGSPSSHSRTMYGTHSPRSVSSDATSRAWTIAAHRSESSISSRPSRMNDSEHPRAVLVVEGRGLEGLDGDGVPPDAVHGAVDDREGRLLDQRLDAVLTSDDGSDEAEGVHCAGGEKQRPCAGGASEGTGSCGEGGAPSVWRKAAGRGRTGRG